MTGAVLRKTAHLADDTNPAVTLCGLDWEPWQAPMPSDDDIGFDELSYGAKVALRQEDRARKRADELTHQCQACFKIARRGGFAA